MNMKKLVALLLALVMVFALCACGPKDNQDTGKKDDGKKTAMKADDIPDEMTSSDGKYQVAFVTDVGDLKDKSFNQGTYDGVKLYANANSKSYKYYKPANGDKATDDDRYDAMKAAVDNGAEVVVAAGFLQGAFDHFAFVRFVFQLDIDRSRNRAGSQFFRKFVAGNIAAGRQQGGILDGVLHLAQVARPRIRLENPDHFIVKTDNIFLQFHIGLVQEVVGKQQKVFFPLFQVGDADCELVDTMI